MVRFVAGVALGLVGGATAAAFSSLAQRAESVAFCAKQPVGIFSPDEFKPFKLIATRYESHDTRRLVFALDTPDTLFTMPVASCVVVKFTGADGKDIVRPYTPISASHTKGHFELLVKKYPRGKMGNHLFGMQQGEDVLIKGPFEKFAYKANMWSHVGMIAGGTGITPMYQVICNILGNAKDRTKISLIYANNQRRDILLANELIELQKTYDHFNMYLTLLDVPHRWLGGIGYVNAAMISTFMPKPGEKNTKVLVCGPPPLLQAICGDKVFAEGSPPQQGPLTGLLRDLGYTEAQVFKF